MNVLTLARQMGRFSSWLEQHEHPELDRHPLCDGIEITIDPASSSPAASYNRNRIYVSADNGDVSAAALAEAVRLFDDRGIERCFAWLSPSAHNVQVREWLSELSFERIPWTRYPTLLHMASAQQLMPTTLEVRIVRPEYIASAHAVLSDTLMDGYLRTVGASGVHHYMAFDGERPVAAAALVQWEDIGYLTYAGTMESARRRGAQSTLIARRVQAARALGCINIVSQTLTMLSVSLGNLQRAGFREIYEQEVYERSA